MPDGTDRGDGGDWQAATFEGNRRLQQQEFRALPFRDKLKVIEQLSLVAEHFAARRRPAKGAAPGPPPPPPPLADPPARDPV